MKVRICRENDPRRPFYVELCRTYGWQVTEGDDFDLLWDLDPPKQSRFTSVGEGQRYSHVWGVGELSIKSRLDQNLVAHRHLLGERGERLYDFFPRSFLMPDDYEDLVAAAKEEPGTIWIQKPKWLSRGRGVELVKQIDQVPRGPEWMVQEYIAWPHLLGERKYTLRFYVLIASLDPLVVYVHDGGFCKFASRPFSLVNDAAEDRFRHLTNPDVLRDDPTMPVVSGDNLTHAAYRQRLRDEGLDDVALFAEIHRIIALTVIATRGQIMRRHRLAGLDWQRGFELMGFDILVDDALLPWLLECNLLPSLEVEAEPETDSARDEHEVKWSVVRDLFGFFADGAPIEDPRSRGFSRVLPAEAHRSLLSAYSLPLASDLVLWHRLFGLAAPSIRVLPDGVEVKQDDGENLVLHDLATGEEQILDGEEAALWRRIGDGVELRALISPLPIEEQPDAWDHIAWWIDTGLLRRQETPALPM